MGYKHLTEEERYQIDDLRRDGFNQEEIAKKIGRSPSTLSRELRRNNGERGWRPRQAQIKAVDRLVARGKNNARKVSDEAWQYAEKHLVNDQRALALGMRNGTSKSPFRPRAQRWYVRLQRTASAALRSQHLMMLLPQMARRQ